MRRLFFLFFFCACPSTWAAQDLLPRRPESAPAGTSFVRSILDLDLVEREKAIRTQFLSGNVPNFWRQFASVKTGAFEYFVAPDYFAIGSDEDYFLTPVTPQTAQILANELDCVLPTPKMVDQIYAAASQKLVPSPIPPSPAMTSVPVFAEHNKTVQLQRTNPASLFGGHKKDIVITKRLADAPGKVAIYGWHQTNSKPIQPLYLGHTAAWVDYSHGARFVKRTALLDGKPVRIENILSDPERARLISNEGPLPTSRYTITNSFAEKIEEALFHPQVRAILNSPAAPDTNKPTRLILYALPNGNTIEQTMGRKLRAGDDWHFDIQHIAAQTRFLRAQDTNANIVVAYLECAEKAWPTWRHKYDTNNTRIPEIVESLRARCKNPRIVLTGHSGGGSFTFGYINGLAEIPDYIERIAFLDSNYAYETPHAEKFARWLNASAEHSLCVLAYHDSIALLEGKTFVSEQGGTWGRSHAMLADLRKKFSFNEEIEPDWKRHTALDGRVKFFLRENPKKEILHTRQVELNGFIHAMLTGTSLENVGYAYFGPRAYDSLIEN